MACTYLPWDSAHFGIRIGRVDARRLTPELVREIDEWSRRESIERVYFLAVSDPATMRLATEAGFRFVDARTTLAVELAERHHSGHAECHYVRPVDLPELQRIAGESHRDSRFYVDGRFEAGACDRLYRNWIERSCREDVVLVAECEGRAAGYVTCRIVNGAGEIGLLAVDALFRGRGLGERLVRQACCWFGEQGAAEVSVVTQGANVSAMRLYQKCGFLVAAVEFWYHR